MVGAYNVFGHLSGGGTKNECPLVQDKKFFGSRLTFMFVGARRFAKLFRKQAISAEDLHDTISLLNTIFIVLVPINTTKNGINTPNLLVS